MTPTLPSTRDEAWRWADLPALEAARALPAGDVAMPAPLMGDAARLVFVDGRLDEARSDLRGLSFAAIALESAHPLAAHAAGAGHVLSVGAGDIARVEIVRIAQGGEAHAALLVEADAGTTVELAEQHVGTGWSNALTRFVLGDGARVSRAVRLAQDAGYVSIRDEAAVAGGGAVRLHLPRRRRGGRADRWGADADGAGRVR